MKELVKLFTKKDPTRSDWQTRKGVVMVLFLILTAIMAAFFGKVLITFIFLGITVISIVVFFADALTDPEWLKGETYD